MSRRRPHLDVGRPRTVLLLAVLLLLAAALPLTVGGAAGAAPAEEPSLAIALTGLSPQAPAPGGTLLITGTLTNTGSVSLDRARLLLRVSQRPLAARSELGLVEAGKGAFEVPGQRVGQPADVGTLAAGETLPFQLSVALDSLGLDGFGVYPLAVEAQGALPGGVRQRAGMVRTLLPWTPRAVAPTRLVWMMPLVDKPSRDAAGVFTDESLGQSLATGRLDRLLQIAASAQANDAISLTWVIDPELLEAVAAMTEGYQVHAAGGGTAPGLHVDAAARWLGDLRAATAGREVLVLPYADPDLVALRRAGRLDEVARAGDRGREVATRLLPSATLISDVAWPAEGYLDAGTLAKLPGLGITSVMLNGAALRPVAETTYTPTGRAVLPGTGTKLDALLSEPDLARAVTSPGRTAGERTLAVQRFLAQTAFITAERPSRSRLVLVSPPKRWDPNPTLLAALLHATSASVVPWTHPADFAELRAAPQDTVLREGLVYPKAVRGRELPAGYLNTAAAIDDRMELFAHVLVDPPAMLAPFEDALLRSESAAWRGGGVDAGRRYQTTVATDLAATMNKVHVVPGRVNFSARRGSLPLTVVNDLDQAVTVRLRLTPRQARLRFVEGPPLLELPAGRREQLTVQAEAVAPGRSDVEAQLVTTDGRAYGDPVTVSVRVTRIGTVALVVTLAALAVLFGAAGLRIVRRVTRAGRGRDELAAPGAGTPEQTTPEGANLP